MDQITETRRSITADFLQHIKRIIDPANPLKGGEKVGISSVLNSDPIGRRRALEHLGILGITLGAAVLFRDIDNKTRPKKRTLTVAAPASYTPPAVEIVKIPDHLDSLEDRLFKNFSQQEKADFEKEITKQIKIYQDQLGHHTKAERVLDWERSTIKPILDLDVSPKNHQFWSEFMSAIAYVESGGKASATSEVEIVGVAQISQATAEATAKKHGIFAFDLKKGWDSLRLSRFHFQDLMERYSLDISLLGYFAGQPFTDQKVLTAIKKGITSDRINIANLGSADGKEYFTKTVAALRILSQARGVTVVQTRG